MYQLQRLSGQNVLLVPYELLEHVGCPDIVKLERSADGLIVTPWDAGEDAPVVIIGHINYDYDDTDMVSMTVPPGCADNYRAWLGPWNVCIYAVPADPAQPATDWGGDTRQSVTIRLEPRVIDVLEQLALDHQVRLTDILIAFAHDLAGGAATGDEVYTIPSGGSDERDFAEQWFDRNVMPADLFEQPSQRSLFVRGESYEPEEARGGDVERHE